MRAVGGLQGGPREGSGAPLGGLGGAGSGDAAARVNGTAGTFLEMDEGNRFSRGHPAVHVIPAALALSQERAASAQDFFAAILVGYEVGPRLGPPPHVARPLTPYGPRWTTGAGDPRDRACWSAPAVGQAMLRRRLEQFAIGQRAIAARSDSPQQSLMPGFAMIKPWPVRIGLCHALQQRCAASRRQAGKHIGLIRIGRLARQ